MIKQDTHLTFVTFFSYVEASYKGNVYYFTGFFIICFLCTFWRGYRPLSCIKVTVHVKMIDVFRDNACSQYHMLTNIAALLCQADVIYSQMVIVFLFIEGIEMSIKLPCLSFRRKKFSYALSFKDGVLLKNLHFFKLLKI